MWDMWAAGKADSPYSELMTYQSEVNNGGHSQYFDNVSNTGDLRKEMSALKTILPPQFYEWTEMAYSANLALEKNADNEKAEKILAKCDDMFYEKEEEINNILKEYSAKFDCNFKINARRGGECRFA